MKALSSAPALVRDAWEFLRKQPVLTDVFLWLLVLPAAFSNGIGDWENAASPMEEPLLHILRVFLLLGLAFLTFWGWSCVLFLGRRMVLHRAGRSRTSLRRARADALPLVLPLITTSLLQAFSAFYRSLLFLIPAILLLLLFHNFTTGPAQPGIVFLAFLVFSPLLLPAALYVIRTSFAPMVVVCEGICGRAALGRSRLLVKGRLWRVTKTLLALAALTLLPAMLLSAIVDAVAAAIQPSLEIATVVTDALFSSLAILLSTLAATRFYGELRDSRPTLKEVEPD